jgi:hypothetical protein
MGFKNERKERGKKDNKGEKKERKRTVPSLDHIADDIIDEAHLRFRYRTRHPVKHRHHDRHVPIFLLVGLKIIYEHSLLNEANEHYLMTRGYFCRGCLPV